MTHSLSGFLVDTLLWTGTLIALVLLLRRPVARHFGPQASYALWALPLIRLVLPPLTLPSWLGPDAGVGKADVVPVDTAAFAAPSAAPTQAGMVLEAPVDLLTPLLILWLAGAVAFLVHRFALYYRMRDELLADARPVGEAGQVRLVESPALDGPVAFGVRDKVVALPHGFMAAPNRQARDLALAHELAHHEARDLLVNFLVQPLFALHWFNPLGWAGWRALRRDQEAACDARVVARRSVEERAAYADVIATFACNRGNAPRAALAAPMACPVLGDKSIIQRLRSLTMNEVSPRRRLAARLGIGAALLALPLTATVTYAEATQDAPDAPTPPDAPDAKKIEREVRIIKLHEGEGEEGEPQVLHLEGDAADGEHHVIIKKITKEGEPTRTERRIIRHGDEQLSAEEQAELDRELAEVDREMAELHRQTAENGEMRRNVRIAIREGHANAPQVIVSCRNPTQPVTSETTPEGKTKLYVCETAGDAIARDAIAKARAAIAADKEMPAEARAEALRSLDESLAEHAE